MVDYGSGIKLSLVVEDDFNKTINNMRSLGKIIGYEAALAVAEGAVALFATAQDLVPVDTGELRESGVAIMELGNRGKPHVIAKGNADGTVDADLSSITPSRFKRLKSGGYQGVNIEISYFRMSSRGKSDAQFPKGTFDVAVFAHEDLSPAPGAWKEARAAGTQGKYLENAYYIHKNEIVEMIRAVVKDTSKIQKYIKREKTGKGQFTVDPVDVSFR